MVPLLKYNVDKWGDYVLNVHGKKTKSMGWYPQVDPDYTFPPGEEPKYSPSYESEGWTKMWIVKKPKRTADNFWSWTRGEGYLTEFKPRDIYEFGGELIPDISETIEEEYTPDNWYNPYSTDEQPTETQLLNYVRSGDALEEFDQILRDKDFPLVFGPKPVESLEDVMFIPEDDALHAIPWPEKEITAYRQGLQCATRCMRLLNQTPERRPFIGPKINPGYIKNKPEYYSCPVFLLVLFAFTTALLLENAHRVIASYSERLAEVVSKPLFEHLEEIEWSPDFTDFEKT